MKLFYLVICSFLLLKPALAQHSVTSFYVPESNSYLSDSYLHNGNEYYLISKNDTLFLNDGSIIDASENAVVVVENNKSSVKSIASISVSANSTYYDNYFFELGDAFGLAISTDADITVNGDTFTPLGGKVNAFVFYFNGEGIELFQQLYNQGNVYIKPSYSVQIGTSIHVYSNHSEITQAKGSPIVSSSKNVTASVYSFLLQYKNDEFESVNDLAFDFYDTNPINYRAPFSYKSTWGNGSLINVLTTGCKAYRNDELLFDTKRQDQKVTLMYPATDFLNEAVKPIIISHDRQYISYADAFTIYDAKYSMYMSPVSAKEICANGDCIQNPDVNTPWEIVLKNYDWQTGKGELSTTFASNGTNIKAGAQNEEYKFLLGDYVEVPAFWDLDENLRNTTISNVFVTDVRGHAVLTEPFVLRSYDKPIALARVAFESAKLIDDKLIFNVPFSIGLIVGTDTIPARTAGDDAIVTIDLSEVVSSANHKAIENEVSIFPNPTSNQLTIATDVTLQNAQFVVYSTNGQQVLNGSTNGTIDVSNLKSGMYLLQIEQTGAKVKKLFVVE